MTNPTTELAAATLRAEIDALRAEVAEWKRVAAAQAELHGEAEERAEQLAEDDAWCAECGVKLENVRPGKHQHPTCSQAALQRPAAVAQPLTDEALLRQALEALEVSTRFVYADLRPQCECSITALRERLAETVNDLTRCPNCGGPTDNGHDREVPPNPYWCSKCTES